MQFTPVIFNTYVFFLGSDAKAILTLTFLTLKNSLLLPYCVSEKINAIKLLSTNAPLKIYLSIKLATCLLNDNCILPFISKLQHARLKLCSIANGSLKN